MQDTLANLFPRVNWRFDEPLVRDGAIETASGPHGYLSLMTERLGRLLGDSVLQDLEKALVLPKPRAEYSLFLSVDLMTIDDPQLRHLLVLAQRTRAAELTLPHAASLISVSVRTLCRHVLARTGIPAGEWLRRVKLRQVGEALTRTNQPVKRISDELGFSSEASLHRVFRQTTGYTPAQFRRAYTEAGRRATL
jgi:transcriptional regulator GlxA family with amidase domain